MPVGRGSKGSYGRKLSEGHLNGYGTTCNNVRTLVGSSDVGALRVLAVLDSWIKQCVDGSYRVLGERELQVAGCRK
jgi:hypothetical protein